MSLNWLKWRNILVEILLGNTDLQKVTKKLNYLT